MRWALLALALSAALPTAGTISPGRGVAGLQLGMTRAAALDLLGKPTQVSGCELSWMDAKRTVAWTARAGDVGGRLDKIQLAVGHLSRYPFCTAGGMCLGVAGGLAKLRAEFGTRLERTTQLGHEAYFVRGTGYRGYDRIMNVAFGYCAGTTIC